MSGKTLEITDSNFEQEVTKSPIPVLVDFWASWCGPCLRMTPIVEELTNDYEGKVKICKMNVDDNMQIPTQFRITSIPTMILFKEGKKIGELIGARPKEHLAEFIKQAL